MAKHKLGKFLFAAGCVSAAAAGVYYVKKYLNDPGIADDEFEEESEEDEDEEDVEDEEGDKRSYVSLSPETEKAVDSEPAAETADAEDTEPEDAGTEEESKNN